jgi:hypothetical protein
VNTKGLARHYDKLTPQERLHLVLAANARGDEVECSRLKMAGRDVHLHVPDTWGLANALKETAEWHYMEVLALAAAYLEALLFANSCGCSDDQAEEDDQAEVSIDQAEHVREAAFALGYLLRVNLAGWRQFCKEHGPNPEAFGALLPGWAVIKRAAQLAERIAFTEEGAARWYERATGMPSQAPTAEDVIALIRAWFQANAEWWG